MVLHPESLGWTGLVMATVSFSNPCIILSCLLNEVNIIIGGGNGLLLVERKIIAGSHYAFYPLWFQKKIYLAHAMVEQLTWLIKKPTS